ncbi:hypothetical protein PCIT_a4059 [Pseudoalteromonas citrea]|uniref:DUF1963 domain-containing protein n=3 Tax=Pseudoalteromonas citrea TaxID=43655 RepID=A0AAD4AIN7_9GAMM|nr:hypothetical protein PCIT_a4059 [Pseudoalteromonas citrea]
MTLSELLSTYSAEFDKIKKQAIRIEMTSLDCQLRDDTLDLRTSKFCGKPFIPKTMNYPVGKYNKKPMYLIAQINFSELPKLDGFPTAGILQVFSESDDCTIYESAVIQFISPEQMLDTPLSDFAFLDEIAEDEYLATPTQQLRFKTQNDFGNSGNDTAISIPECDTVSDLLEKIQTEHKMTDRDFEEVIEKFDSLSAYSKIGGYSLAVQEPFSEDEMMLVLQLDYLNIENAVGDGSLYLHVPKKDLIQSDFSDAQVIYECT